MTASRLVIDWTRCDGHGLCTRLLSERMAADDWGFPVLAPGPLGSDELAAARDAVAACPQLALRIERD